MKRWAVLVWLIIAASSCTTHITPQLSQSPEHVHTDAHVHSKIAYVMAWDWGKAQPDEANGWRVTNDLGYAIHITDGALVNAALQLVPCSDSTGLFAPQAAYAGHGGGKPDETRWSGPLRESLGKPITADLGTVELDDHRYCQAHYLLAPSEVTGPTFVLTGTYLAPNSKTPVAFALNTSTAWGGITDFPKDSVIDGNTQQAPLRMTLMRNLGALLDGVDFEAMTPDQQARVVLRSLTSNIQILQ